MSKKQMEENNINTLSELVSDLPTKEIEPMISEMRTPLSPESIKTRAFEKRNTEKERMEELSMKPSTNQGKKPVKFFTKFIASVAIVAMLSVSAFAFSQSDIMRSLFKGENKEIIDGAMFTPMESAEANGVTMTVQSVLSDGYNAIIVVSLENAEPIENDFFTSDSGEKQMYDPIVDVTNADIGRIGLEPTRIDEYSNDKIQYFQIPIMFEENLSDIEVTLTLSPRIAPITLTTKLVSNLEFKTVVFPEGTIIGEAELTELQISPISYQFVAKDDENKSAFPSTKVTMKFNDGVTKDFSLSALSQEQLNAQTNPDYDHSKDEIDSLSPMNFPLFWSYSFKHGGVEDGSYADGTLYISGRFSEIIDTENLKEIVINDLTYPIE